MSTALTQMRENLSAFWSDRNEREKKQIMLAAAVAVLGLTYMLLIDPAYSGRIRLEKELPVLRQQAAELEALAKEAAPLANLTPPPVPDMSKEMLEAAMTRAGLKAQSVSVAGNIADVQFSSASFAAISSWLDELQKAARISVSSANVTPLSQQDTVNATFKLRQQKSE
jgi:general secretion pathway protein M